MVGLDSNWLLHVERGPGWLYVAPRTIDHCLTDLPIENRRVNYGSDEDGLDASRFDSSTTQFSRSMPAGRSGENSITSIATLDEHRYGGVDTLPASEWSTGFADRIWDMLNQHLVYRLVLELDELRELPDELIDQLVDLYHRVVSHDGMIRICALDAHCTDRLLSQTDLTTLRPYPDRTTAVMGYHRSR